MHSAVDLATVSTFFNDIAIPDEQRLGATMLQKTPYVKYLRFISQLVMMLELCVGECVGNVCKGFGD